MEIFGSSIQSITYRKGQTMMTIITIATIKTITTIIITITTTITILQQKVCKYLLLYVDLECLWILKQIYTPAIYLLHFDQDDILKLDHWLKQ